MSTIDVKWVTDKATGDPIFPITHIDAVRDDDGNPLSDYLDNNEVEIGETAPIGTPKLFVDEDADPAISIDVYTREEIDQKLAFSYDPTTKGMVFPTDTSIVEYDSTTKGMIFH